MIKKLRIKLQFTQSEFSKLLFCSTASISRFEKGAHISAQQRLLLKKLQEILSTTFLSLELLQECLLTHGIDGTYVLLVILSKDFFK